MLMMVGAAGALVVAAALLIRPLVGALLGLVLVGVGLWRSWGLLQDWRRLGSDPGER